MSADRPTPTPIPFGTSLDGPSAEVLRALAEALAGDVFSGEPGGDPLAAARRLFTRLADEARVADDDDLKACAYVLIDLKAQGWGVAPARTRDADHPLEISKPPHHRGGRESNDDVPSEVRRALIRRQLNIARDEQLREPAPRAFVKAMETVDPRAHRRAKIFDLMRDGRQLREEIEVAQASADSNAALARVIQPYIQVIERSDQRCERTGFTLQEIWRYFRYTWATPAKSVPGRSMNILVRDAAVDPYHPVIGIAALSSAVVNLKRRDEEIGWAPDDVVKRLRAQPTDEDARWLARLIDESLAEIHLHDLMAMGPLTPSLVREPTEEIIQWLGELAVNEREAHTKHDSRASAHKRLDPSRATDAEWRERSETHLFRSKRARSLATLLRCRRAFAEHMGDPPSGAGLARLLGSVEGRRLARSLILKAKADRVGICIADITVCGALPPYSDLLGGKLVSILMASPEIVEAYRRRYAESVSVIASSMAGRAILRPPTLVFLATTSLYGRSIQYNRLKMPTSVFGDAEPAQVAFKEVGRTDGTGTLQFTRETVSALRGRFDEGELRVNNVFGEGVNPRMRLIRESLDALDLEPDKLLSHGNPRAIFAVRLIRNLRRFLLGLDDEPRWLVPQDEPTRRTDQIVAWWRDHWLSRRVKKRAILDRLNQHSLAEPVRHGARVRLPPDEPSPEDDDQLDFFDDIE